MTWAGFLGRDLAGEMRHTSGNVIPLRGKHRDGVIYLEGGGPETHWRGEISADRARFYLGCKLGFVIRGTCALVKGRYEMAMTRMDKPDWALLPGEKDADYT